MNPLILTFLTMGIQLVLFTNSGASNPSVFCKFVGDDDDGAYKYVFNVTSVQNDLQSCDIFAYSTYYFDVEPAMSTNDENAIKALVGIGKVVYTAIMYFNDYSKWSELLNPKENEEVFNAKIDKLVKFLSEHQISGVIMRGLSLYQSDSPSTGQNVADFATTLKAKMKNNLKVGMKIGGYEYLQFTNSTAFNYNDTNSVIDHYFVDLTGSNYCSPETKHTTVNPLHSKNNNLLTLENQSIGVSKSAMEKSKVYAVLQVNTILSILYYNPQYEGEMKYGSYSELCTFTDKYDILRWCSDYTAALYEQGKFATKYYRGIMLSVLEGDDPYGDCTCGPFIVSNAIIIGWKLEDKPKCAKLDALMKIT